jgi:hypothetical protein
MTSKHKTLVVLGVMLLGILAPTTQAVPRMIMIEDFDNVF